MHVFFKEKTGAWGNMISTRVFLLFSFVLFAYFVYILFFLHDLEIGIHR